MAAGIAPDVPDQGTFALRRQHVNDPLLPRLPG
jgi:hypothetical protein